MTLTRHFLKTWGQRCLGPCRPRVPVSLAACRYPGATAAPGSGVEPVSEQLKPLKPLLRGNLLGISEAAGTSRQPRLETFNWEGWESRGSPGCTQPAGSKAGKELAVQGLGLQRLPQ